MGSGSNWAACYTGGSGAGYHAKIIISQAGEYTVTVGSGGKGRGGARGEKANATTDGQASIFSKDGTNLIYAGGGTRGYFQAVGRGGTLIKNNLIVENKSYVQSNGYNGSSGVLGANGVGGPIKGHTWGRSGNCSSGWGGGTAYQSCHGYIIIKYIGPLPKS